MRKIILFALLGLLAVSCSDDDPTVLEEDIVGVWTLIDDYPGLTLPAGTPKYIRFDGSAYYSSDSEPNPTSNRQGYSISFSTEVQKYVLNINGDSREYRITLSKFKDEDLLDLSYVVDPAVPADEEAGTPAIPEKRQSLPYKRSITQN